MIVRPAHWIVTLRKRLVQPFGCQDASPGMGTPCEQTCGPITIASGFPATTALGWKRLAKRVVRMCRRHFDTK